LVLGTICLGWPCSWILSISASQVARITGMSHQCPVCFVCFLRQRLTMQPRQSWNLLSIQVGLELLILLPPPPECWDSECAPPGPAMFT
jgi:hypothetical protein